MTFLVKRNIIITVEKDSDKKGKDKMKITGILKAAALAAVCAMSIGLFAGCGDTDSSSAADSKASSKAAASGAKEGSFVITLYADKAPITCENFEKLIKDGFYDGLTFHRIVNDFCAQGGDPNGNGTGGSSEKIKGEFSENGVENDLSHTKGIVSMARGKDMDSASSQFFVCLSDKFTNVLDGKYAAFGKVTEGMEVVEDFQNVERTTGGDGKQSFPIQPITIVKAEMIGDDDNGNHRAQFTVSYYTGAKEVNPDDYTEQTAEFTAVLYKDKAPVTCENFEKLVKDGFYDGLTFHRIIDNFIMQGGDPKGDGTGGAKETIKGEFSQNGVENDLSHTKGVLSMARGSADPDSASSQFFICLSDKDAAMDGQYAAFGKVVEGMDKVDEIAAVEKQKGSDQYLSEPVMPVTIQKAEIVDPDADGNTQVKFTVSYYTAK